MNVARRADGTWGGDVFGQNLDLQMSPSRLTGPNVSIAYAIKDGRTIIEGLFFGQRIRLELDGKRLHGKVGACSLDLSRKSPQLFQGNVGCIPSGRTPPRISRANLQLLGAAGNDPPPMPQLALALVAILPG